MTARWQPRVSWQPNKLVFVFHGSDSHVSSVFADDTYTQIINNLQCNVVVIKQRVVGDKKPLELDKQIRQTTALRHNGAIKGTHRCKHDRTDPSARVKQKFFSVLTSHARLERSWLGKITPKGRSCLQFRTYTHRVHTLSGFGFSGNVFSLFSLFLFCDPSIGKGMKIDIVQKAPSDALRRFPTR